MSVYRIVPLNVPSLTDEQLRIHLIEIAEEFPFSANNYAAEMLSEAAKRINAIDEASNK